MGRTALLERVPVGENGGVFRHALTAVAAVLAGLVLTADAPTGPPTEAQIWETLRYVYASTTHGPADQDIPVEELRAVSQERTVELTCGYVAAWAKYEVERLGGQARLAHVLTLDEWNDDDNGHTMVSVMVDGEWVLFDPDVGVTFHDRSGEALSLAEWIPLVETGEYEMELLGTDVQDDHTDDLRSWYERVAQWPLLTDDDGRIWYPDDGSDAAARVGSYSSKYLPAPDWHERFYA